MANDIQATPANPLAAVLSNPDLLKDLDVDKLERLADLHMQMLARDAKLAYAVAMNAAQTEARPVKRFGYNDSTRSSYARLEDIERMLDPIIHKHGFSVSISNGEPARDGYTRYVAVVLHAGGHETTHDLEAPFDDVGMKGSPTKTKIHGMKSARSYCRRILKSEIFDVSETSDDDGNAAGGIGPGAGTISTDQVIELSDLIKETGANRELFLKACKVSRLEDLALSMYAGAKARLEMKKATS